MIRGKIYTENEIQAVWKQHFYCPMSVVWSDDGGMTWNPSPSMDTGKWHLKSRKDGKLIPWVYTLDPKCVIIEVHKVYILEDNVNEVPVDKYVGKTEQGYYIDLSNTHLFGGFEKVSITNRMGANITVLLRNTDSLILKSGYVLDVSTDTLRMKKIN